MHTNYIFSALALALPVYSLSSTASMGCYSAVESFKNQGPYTYQSPGHCQAQCADNNFKVAALSRGNMCYCGNKIPSDSTKVADDKCDIACTGWAAASCGGIDTFNIIQAAEDLQASPSENASTTIAPAAATAAGGIVVAASTAVAPTSIVAATSTVNSKSGTAVSKSVATSGAVATASPTPTSNAAGTVRVGSSLLGAVVAGMSLLL
ncbi:Carbohydrate-binding WSC, subgroup [Penicillium italicum]|uniref:Carbohydrate-binding WSC, subgroup n=1 Tax=Penicillium italicum TaxID=40296 RepID=A0A0A2L5P9_PENIT|nr:Carbohydrate-binding WSC, subgroup [Penicillium italicum]